MTPAERPRLFILARCILCEEHVHELWGSLMSEARKPVPPTEELREAYAEHGSLRGVSDGYDVDPKTVARWMHVREIEYADRETASRRAVSKPYAPMGTVNGYPTWTPEPSMIVYVHDLVAIAAGVDPHDLWADPAVVEVGFDDYQPAFTAEFAIEIREMPWRSREKLIEAAEGAQTMPDVAEALGCDQWTVRKWLKRYGLERGYDPAEGWIVRETESGERVTA